MVLFRKILITSIIGGIGATGLANPAKIRLNKRELLSKMFNHRSLAEIGDIVYRQKLQAYQQRISLEMVEPLLEYHYFKRLEKIEHYQFFVRENDSNDIADTFGQKVIEFHKLHLETLEKIDQLDELTQQHQEFAAYLAQMEREILIDTLTLASDRPQVDRLSEDDVSYLLELLNKKS